ncbi:DUF2069 domain-containing protein [Lysobacter brunescens]|uniref:DUF2069 domain-containing protein n=1 Tax=Lysobacter brunescens TaxID=262323 RepID=A0ABW2YDX3_9GAMM
MLNAPTPPPAERLVLVASLFALAGLFAWWVHDSPHRIAGLLLFALPPLLLGLGALAGKSTARFWAGVFALGWFSHGVMVAWADAAQRPLALAETVLAVVIIFASSAPGLRARFGRKRGSDRTSE